MMQQVNEASSSWYFGVNPSRMALCIVISKLLSTTRKPSAGYKLIHECYVKSDGLSERQSRGGPSAVSWGSEVCGRVSSV